MVFYNFIDVVVNNFYLIWCLNFCLNDHEGDNDDDDFYDADKDNDEEEEDDDEEEDE